MPESGIVVILDEGEVFAFWVKLVIHRERARIGAGADMDRSSDVGLVQFFRQFRQEARSGVFHAVLSGDYGENGAGAFAADSQDCNLKRIAFAIFEGVPFDFHADVPF